MLLQSIQKIINKLTKNIIFSISDYPIRRDHIIRGYSLQYNFLFSFVDNTKALATAVENFSLNDKKQIDTLGKCFSSSLLISSLLKGEERIKVEVMFKYKNNQIAQFYAESLANGEIRGLSKLIYSQEYNIPNPILKVGKVLYNYTQENFSVVNLKFNETDEWVKFDYEELQNYFKQSDQIQTLCQLYTDYQKPKDHTCRASSSHYRSIGMLLQKMPQCNEEMLSKLHRKLIQSDEWKQCLDGKFNASLIKKLFEKQGITDTTMTRYPVDFYCRCNKEHFKKVLSNLGLQTIKEMEMKRENALKCFYCNKTHYLDEMDFKDIIQKFEQIIVRQ